MLEQELAAESFAVSVSAMASILGPNLAEGKVSNALRAVQERVDVFNALRRFSWEPRSDKEDRLREESSAAIDVYKEMKRSGSFEVFDKKSSEIYNSRQN